MQETYYSQLIKQFDVLGYLVTHQRDITEMVREALHEHPSHVFLVVIRTTGAYYINLTRLQSNLEDLRDSPSPDYYLNLRNALNSYYDTFRFLLPYNDRFFLCELNEVKEVTVHQIPEICFAFQPEFSRLTNDLREALSYHLRIFKRRLMTEIERAHARIEIMGLPHPPGTRIEFDTRG